MPLEHADLTGSIIAAAIDVHRALGPGFLEAIYENALAVELTHRGLSFQRQVAVPTRYRDVEVGLHRLDLLVVSTIVVELKAVRNLDDVHFAVVRSYLRATGLSHGLLLNFEKPVLEIRRVLASG